MAAHGNIHAEQAWRCGETTRGRGSMPQQRRGDAANELESTQVRRRRGGGTSGQTVTQSVNTSVRAYQGQGARVGGQVTGTNGLVHRRKHKVTEACSRTAAQAMSSRSGAQTRTPNHVAKVILEFGQLLRGGGAPSARPGTVARRVRSSRTDARARRHEHGENQTTLQNILASMSVSKRAQRGGRDCAGSAKVGLKARRACHATAGKTHGHGHAGKPLLGIAAF